MSAYSQALVHYQQPAAWARSRHDLGDGNAIHIFHRAGRNLITWANHFRPHNLYWLGIWRARTGNQTQDWMSLLTPSYHWSTTNVLLLFKKIMKMICHVGYLLKHYNSNMCFNMDGPWVHCAKWNKLVTKRHVLYNPTCLRYLEWSHLRKQKRECWFPGTEDRRKCRAASRHRGCALQDEKFQRLVAYQFLNGLTSSEWLAERWSKWKNVVPQWKELWVHKKMVILYSWF